MSPSPDRAVAADVSHLAHAARLAWRGHGGAEPNPLVGCVIVRDGAVAGEGYHRRCGAAHAEVNALRAAGDRARGATAYVTLEPCAHHGRTPPCAAALVEAGVARVVYAVADPHPEAKGGAVVLREAGVAVDRVECVAAQRVTAPFVQRVTTGLPWVLAKWAQTVDGRIATRTGESRWISGPMSRRLVHRERGRVDAVLTGLGTVRADDPRLTAREVRPRRVARRVVIDADFETPPAAALVTSAREVPTTIIGDAARLEAGGDAVDRLRDAGVDLLGAPGADGHVDLAAALRLLSSERDVATVLVEAGGGLLGALFDADLVDGAWVFVAPLVLGDDAARPALTGRTAPALTDGTSLELLGSHRRGEDVLLRYLAKR